MKRLSLLIVILVMILCCSTAWAYQLKWDASTGAAGYEISYKTLAATTWTTADAGALLTWVIPVTLVKGTRYEFKARAYVGPVATRSYSGDSDILRWTIPLDSAVIEYPDAPRQVIIQFGP